MCFWRCFTAQKSSVGSAGTDADVKALFDSLQVRQEDNHAVLSATLPTEFFRKLVDSPEQVPGLPAPSDQSRKDHKRK